MKDEALCKLPLSLTKNSQGWDKNNNNNAPVTDMTTEQCDNYSTKTLLMTMKSGWQGDLATGSGGRQPVTVGGPGQAAQGVTLL